MALLAIVFFTSSPEAKASTDSTMLQVLTYNVHGLPPEVGGNREDEIEAIAEKLEDFHEPGGSYEGVDSIVALQEVFHDHYYDLLTDPQAMSYLFTTIKNRGGLTGIGDGLTFLSDFYFTGYDREDWVDCAGSWGDDGSDCDTDKGYGFARFELLDDTFVHVYNLHADAGQDVGSRKARRDNVRQLIEAIQEHSPPPAPVIVMGDFNSLYTRAAEDGDNIETLLAGAEVLDVWVELRREGMVPAPGEEIDDDCAFHPATAGCELVDKIFYRSGDTVTLTPLDYFVPDWLFVDESGQELSDHDPVAAMFELKPDPLCGDANADGTVKSADALLVLRAAVGSAACDAARCDHDGNGEILTADALAVLQTAVGVAMRPNCPPAA